MLILQALAFTAAIFATLNFVLQWTLLVAAAYRQDAFRLRAGHTILVGVCWGLFYYLTR